MARRKPTDGLRRLEILLPLDLNGALERARGIASAAAFVRQAIAEKIIRDGQRRSKP